MYDDDEPTIKGSMEDMIIDRPMGRDPGDHRPRTTGPMKPPNSGVIDPVATGVDELVASWADKTGEWAEESEDVAKILKIKKRVDAMLNNFNSVDRRSSGVAPLLNRARRLRDKTAEFIDTIELDDHRVSLVRGQLIDSYLDLNRVIEEIESQVSRTMEVHSRAVALERKSSIQNRRRKRGPRGTKQTASARAEARKRLRAKRRLQRMGLVVIVLVAIKVVTFYTLEQYPLVAPLKEASIEQPGNASVKGRVVSFTADQEKKGIPVMTAIAIINKGDSLVARAHALDPNNDKLTYSYAWRRDGNTLSTDRNEIKGEDLQAGSSYEVSVSASDGANTSARLVSKPLIYHPK